MALTPGTRLGAYEVLTLLGSGGMGEVYRARDTKLNRDVAIKVLPEIFAADPERLARFQREAQLLASLNHPHIGGIYGLEESNGLRALVLELVEGSTLADRIAESPIPVDEALPIARQIAEALGAAHEQGIIHRDLKPANIKVRSDGTVKVLDFGLAKAMEPGAGSSPSVSMSPTLSIHATQAGMILGTAAYMAPEQARGRGVDKRADLWALGCVVYEMLTAEQIFAGETTTDILAAVVTKEPDFARLPTATPPQLRWLLTRCLQKDSNLRFRDAADAAALLGATFDPPSARSRGRLWIAGAAALVVLASGVSAAIVRSRSAPPAPTPVRFDIPVTGAPVAQHISISPDGRRLVYLAATQNGSNALWVRSLDALDAKLITGTENIRGNVSPFWSPDNRSVAFAADGKLKKIDSAGGVAETLVPDVAQFCCGAWSRDGTIVFASNDHGLRAIPASGGQAVEVSERDSSLEETWHDCPSFLPDGRHFLYLGYSESKPENRWVYIGSLDQKTRTRLMPSSTCAVYAAPGFVVFPRNRTLMARPFDPDRLKFTGDAVPIVEELATFSGGELAAFAVSESGTLIYRKDPSQAAGRHLVWMDRNGKASVPIGAPTRSAYVRLSPDAKRVAYFESVESGPDDVWIYDIERDVRLRLTTDPAEDHIPVWSPDGSRVIFDSHRGGKPPTLYERPSSGAVPEHALIETEPKMANSPRDWSSDGRFLVFSKSLGGSPPWDIWVLPLSGGSKPFPYVVSPFDESAASLSFDGRWLAYTTNESGKYQVVVQPFPDPSGGKWQISIDGGASPRWRRDGKEIYYLTPSGAMVAASVTSDTKFEVGQATTLFQTSIGYAGGVPSASPYDVAADGQRFLLSTPVGTPTSTPITTILNWTSTLKQAN